jgi:PTS system nitrogen regulatory IIA component
LPTLEALTDPKLIFPDLRAGDGRAVLRELAGHVAAAGGVRDAAELYDKLWEREQLGSTAIGRGIAIPHCKLEGLARVMVAVGLAPGGVDFGAPDAQPVKVFFVVASPSRSPAEHLQCLAAISRWAKGRASLEPLVAQHDPAQVAELLREGA